MTENFLLRTLELAQQRRGFCAPNPAVGSVVVFGDKIVSEGTHFAAGQPHAEVEAMREVSDAGATVYVSLEPCCHQGRTPPCTELLIAKRVKRVIYGFRDPNPKVAGKGEARLREAGIDVQFLPHAALDAFYRSYAHWTQTGRPWITAKLAMSLDAKVAGPEGQPVPLTSGETNQLTHFKRLHSDAILTSWKTIAKDNPQLNARFKSEKVPPPFSDLDSSVPRISVKGGGTFQETVPKVVAVVDRLAQMPVDARVFQTASKVYLFVGSEANVEQVARLSEAGAKVIALHEEQGVLPLSSIVSRMGELGFHDVWLEAGPSLFEAFLRARLVNHAYVYVAPVMVGEGVAAFSSHADGLFAGAQTRWDCSGRDGILELVW